MLEFRINEHLSLRLEEDTTIIYVDKEQFDQCKFLLLNIPFDEISSLDEIKSVDEAAEKLDSSAEEGSKNFITIPPETEFWGHCSNLQVWYEYNYDTRLIHRSIAFPLLKKLTEVGDLQAKRVFKEEIAKRFVEGNEAVKNFLIEEEYLDYLEREEFWSLFSFDTNPLQDIEKLTLRPFRLVNNFDEATLTPAFRVENNQITALALWECGLQELPESIGELTELKRLFLEINNLKFLPDSIGNLKSLQKLYLNGNQLDTFPKSFFKLTNLKELLLEANKFKELSKEIGNFKSLEILDLDSNSLKYLPDTINKLTNLKKLDLKGNKFETLPNNLKNLKDVKILLYGNPLGRDIIQKIRQEYSDRIFI